VAQIYKASKLTFHIVNRNWRLGISPSRSRHCGQQTTGPLLRNPVLNAVTGVTIAT